MHSVGTHGAENVRSYSKMLELHGKIDGHTLAQIMEHVFITWTYTSEIRILNWLSLANATGSHLYRFDMVQKVPFENVQVHNRVEILAVRELEFAS